MIVVDRRVHVAAHRFGIVSRAGGRKTSRYAEHPIGYVPFGAADEVSEFSDGREIISRRVVAMGDEVCWLRADIATEAETMLRAETDENQRVAEDVVAWSLERDREAAGRRGVDVETYRRKRNALLARLDHKRGRNSIGLG